MTSLTQNFIKQQNFKIYLYMALMTFMLGTLGTVISYYCGWGLTGTGGFLILSGIINYFSYFFSHKLVLRMSKAKLLEKNQVPELFEIVERLCQRQGLPMPKVYLIDDDAMNAFATGRDAKHSAIAVTRGLLEKLELPEVEGVVAHELAHIQNGDMRLMTIVTLLVGFVSILADMYWYGMNISKVDEKDRSGIAAIIGVVLSLFTPITAMLIQLAISRKREYVADAMAAQTTNNPDGLAVALEKIKRDMRPLPSAGVTMAHLFFSNPAKSGDIIDKIFSTHPPIDERIAALRNIKNGGLNV